MTQSLQFHALYVLKFTEFYNFWWDLSSRFPYSDNIIKWITSSTPNYITPCIGNKVGRRGKGEWVAEGGGQEKMNACSKTMRMMFLVRDKLWILRPSPSLRKSAAEPLPIIMLALVSFQNISTTAPGDGKGRERGWILLSRAAYLQLQSQKDSPNEKKTSVESTQ